MERVSLIMWKTPFNPLATDSSFDPITKQQVDNFLRRMDEIAKFNRNFTLFLAASQLRRLQQVELNLQPSHQRITPLALPLAIPRLVWKLALKPISLVFRNKRQETETDVGSPSQDRQVIIEVFQNGTRASDGATIYRSYSVLSYGPDEKRSVSGETDN